MERICLPGKQNAMRRYYVHREYIFMAVRYGTDRINLRCSVATCPSTGHCSNSLAPSNVILHQHNHLASAVAVANIRLKQACLYAATEQATSLRTLYDLFKRSFPESDISWPNMNRAMREQRRGNSPRLPTTVAELENDLRVFERYTLDRNNQPFYRGVVRGSNVVFVSHKLAGLLVGGRTIMADATFKMVPRLFYQMLTVHSYDDNRYNRNSFPVAFVLMQNKMSEDYEAVFRYLRSICPNFRPTNIMTDFESGLQSTLCRVFPEARVSGCFFHYCQAVILKAKRIGLTSVVEDKRSEACSVIRALCALPLLPADTIQRGYQICLVMLSQLNSQQVSSDVKHKLERLAAYWQRQWMVTVGVDIISVYGLQERTNNAVESFHNQLRLAFQTRKNIWEFISDLQDFESRYAGELSISEENRPIRLENRGQRGQRSTRIERLWSNLPDNPSDHRLERFIRAAGHCATDSIRVAPDNDDELIQPAPAHPQPSSVHAQPAPVNQQPAPAYPQHVLLHPQPELVHPQPPLVHPQPAPVHPQTTPAYPQRVPLHPQPAPVHPQPTPAYPQPAPAYPQPAPAYPQPAPAYPQHVPLHLQRAPVHSQTAQAHLQRPPAYSQPVQAHSSYTVLIHSSHEPSSARGLYHLDSDDPDHPDNVPTPVFDRHLSAYRSHTYSSHTEPSYSSYTEPSHSRHTERSHSSYTEPSHSSYTEPSHLSYTEPSHSSYTEQLHPSHKEPTHSSHTGPSHSSHTEPTHSSRTELSHSSHTEPTHSSHTEPSYSPHTELSHTSHIELLHSSHTQPSHYEVGSTASRSNPFIDVCMSFPTPLSVAPTGVGSARRIKRKLYRRRLKKTKRQQTSLTDL